MVLDPSSHHCNFNYPTFDPTLKIDFSSLKISDSQLDEIVSRMFSQYDVTKIQDLTFDISLNNIGKFDSLERFNQYSSLASLKISLDDKGNYSFMHSYTKFKPLKFFQLNGNPCEINRKFINVTDDYKHWECSACYKYCGQCFGGSENQCYSCSDPRLTLNVNKCDYAFDAIKDGSLSVGFNNFQIDQNLFIGMMDKFNTKFAYTSDLKNLVFDISFNSINNMTELKTLAKYLGLEGLNMNLEQSIPIDNYNFMPAFNSLMNLTSIQTSAKDKCDMTQNYIKTSDQIWSCEACQGFCKGCTGPLKTNCKSCIGRKDQLSYDATQHQCVFVF